MLQVKVNIFRAAFEANVRQPRGRTDQLSSATDVMGHMGSLPEAHCHPILLSPC